MAYAVGQGGCLTRCDATAFPRGGLMGLSDRCTGAIPRIDTLCRTIVAECVKRGFQGVLADFETNPYSDRLSFLSRLSARLSARGMALYCPLSLPAEGPAGKASIVRLFFPRTDGEVFHLLRGQRHALRAV